MSFEKNITLPSSAQGSAVMCRPPVNRAMRVLDRSFFKKNVPLYAAKVRDQRNIAKFKSELSRDILKLERIQQVQKVCDGEGTVSRVLLLRPDIRTEGIEFQVEISMEATNR